MYFVQVMGVGVLPVINCVDPLYLCYLWEGERVVLSVVSVGLTQTLHMGFEHVISKRSSCN